MKEILRRLAWRTKIGWVQRGGHYIDSDGVYTTIPPFDLYRFVYVNRKTGAVRYEDQALNPWWVRIGLPVLEVFAVLVIFAVFYLAWLVLP